MSPCLLNPLHSGGAHRPASHGSGHQEQAEPNPEGLVSLNKTSLHGEPASHFGVFEL